MNNVKRNKKGQFQKGTKSPNPGGRPKGSISSIMRKFMYDINDSGFSRIQHLCFILWDKAMKGDINAMKVLIDRIDGTPKQFVETKTSYDRLEVIEITGNTDFN